MKDLKNLSESFINDLNKVNDLDSLSVLKTHYSSKKGVIQELLRDLSNLSNPEEKKAFGKEINDLKNFISQKIEDLETSLNISKSKIETATNFDATESLPSFRYPGNLHFYSKFAQEIEDIFLSMGYEMFDGPEVETDYYNFTALNIPKDHPARDMQDTLWIKNQDLLLRTQTSSVQVRMMLEKGAPLAGIALGRVYRHEAIDATHEMMFTQCEGLLVDKNISLSHFFGVAKTFLQEFFKQKEVTIRIRPGFFPFVTPGVEIDMKCVFCKEGCSICKKSTWIEILPGGLIHPEVLKAGKIDPKIYSGFAFCVGVERLAMLRHGINDIRLFKSGNMKFLSQF